MLAFNRMSGTQANVTELELRRRVREDKDGAAADVLGDKYWKGDGVDQDVALAFQWFRWGHEHGNRNCTVSCAYCCFNGIGTDMDRELGLHYYKLAAQAGSVIACHNVARSFEVAKDVAAAALWYQKGVDSKDEDPHCDACRQSCEQWLVTNAHILKHARKEAAV